MTNVIEIRSEANESESRATLDGLCLEGARAMLHRALEVEVEDYLERHNESFNAVFRDGCLNRWLFESLREGREASEAWLQEYNGERPHGSLGGLTPSKFFEQGQEQQREAA